MLAFYKKQLPFANTLPRPGAVYSKRKDLILELIIITGLSGAGKSGTINALEDIGFYCVDNIPPPLIPTFAELCELSGEIDKARVAIVTDMRGREFFKGFFEALNSLKAANFIYKLLFLDAKNEKLEMRYKETRRKHPLIDESNSSVAEAIKRERELLKPAKDIADYIVDTTHFTAVQLKEHISKIFLENFETGMLITCISFGFKHGPCTEADLIFDVRCLPNPFYIKDLKHKTGLDKEVSDYIFNFPQAVELNAKITDLINFLIPQYLNEGKSQLTIGFGCTGGKHRSVAFADSLYKYLQNSGNRVTVNHRDKEIRN